MIYFKREDLPPAPDLPGRLIMRCVSGSQAYGMATPESDVDIRGIFVPTMKYMLGFMNRVEQIELKPETVIYAIQKFMALAANANPNILELLFVPDDCLLDVDPLYQRLVENRQLFLSRKVRWSYVGYSCAQIHRIEVHRRYLLHPIEHAPVRSAFGLPEGEHFVSREQVGAFYVTLAHILRGMIDISEPEIKDLYRNVVAIVCSEAFPGWEGIVQSQGVPDAALPYVQKLTGASDNFIYALQREQAYYRQVDEWNKYQTWLKQRNPKRAALEARWGLDVKHAAHAIRLIMQGEEIMRTGTLTVRLPNADKIRAIRDGVWLDGSPITYDKIVAYVKQKEIELQQLYISKECVLPKEPDRKTLDELCIEIVKHANEP
jgi:predicted nucleotidyltransferase